MTIKPDRQGELEPLVGQPFRGIDRIGETLIVHFGELQPIAPARGATRFVGEWLLEVQAGCPWRLSRPGQILIGSGDVKESPLGDPREPEGTAPTRFDLAAHFLRNEISGKSLIVQSLELDGVQGFRMVMSDEYTFMVFPADTDVDFGPRYWHVIPPHTDK